MNNISQPQSSQSPSNQLQLIREIDRIIVFYGGILLGIPGIFLNVLNVIVFNQKSFSGSVRIFYTFQSIIDGLRILNTMYIQFPTALGQDFTTWSEFMCKFANFFQRVVAHLCSWILVLITIDRMMSILYSLKYKQITGTKYSYTCLCFIFIILSAINWSNFSFSLVANQINVNNQIIVTRSCVLPSQFSAYLNIVGFMVRAVVPFIIMFICNLVLIYELYSQKKRVNKLSRKDFNFALTIVAINYLFFIFSMVLNFQQAWTLFPQSNTDEQRALSLLLNRAGVYFNLIFYSFTFFFYLKFNSIFRKEVLRMLKRNLNRINYFNTSA
jgi:hypothetical protein